MKGPEMKPLRLNVEETLELLRHAAFEKPFLLYFVPLFFLAWAFEKWVFSFSNWIPLAIAVWATLQVTVLRDLIRFLVSELLNYRLSVRFRKVELSRLANSNCVIYTI